MTLESTQPLTEISTKNISWGVKVVSEQYENVKLFGLTFRTHHLFFSKYIGNPLTSLKTGKNRGHLH